MSGRAFERGSDAAILVPMVFRGHVLLLASTPLWGSACGSDEPEADLSGVGDLFERVEGAPQKPPAPSVVADFKPAFEESAWTVRGAKRTLVREIWASEDRLDTNGVPAVVLVGGESPSLERDLAEAASGIGRIEVDLSFWGPGSPTVEVVLLGNSGRDRWRSEPRSIGRRRGPETLVVEAQDFRALERRVGGVRLEFAALDGPLGVVGVRLIDIAPRSHLPSFRDPDHVTLGTSTRRAAGMFAGDSVSFEFVARDGDVLHLASAAPTTLPPAAGLRLSIGSGDGADDDHLERVLRTRAGVWSDERIDLAAWAGSVVTLELEVPPEAGARKSGCLVGDLRVVARQSAPRSVVLMSSDTHRGDYLGATARDFELFTPNLDALGRRGVRFLDCFSTTNVTNPSHVSMLTGLHPRDTGIVDNTTPLVDEALTLAECFQAAGYRTFAATSAMHLSPRISGLAQGFDRVDAPERGGRSGDVAVDVVRRWVEESAGEPVFVFLHIYEAHAPYRPPAEHAARHLEGEAGSSPHSNAPDLPSWAREYVPERLYGSDTAWIPERLYRAEVETVDEVAGRVLGIPRLADGVFVFLSDHGESFGARGVWWDHASLAPGNLGVPLIIAAPFLEPETVRERVLALDVGRTLLDLAGLGAVEFPGEDLLRDGRPDEPRYSLSAHGEAAGITHGRWHLTLGLRDCPASSTKQALAHGEVILVDLRDPEPRPNRVDDELERATKLRAALIRWLDQAPRKRLAGTPATLDAEAVAGLEALGYTAVSTVTDGAWWDPRGVSEEWLERFDE